MKFFSRGACTRRNPAKASARAYSARLFILHRSTRRVNTVPRKIWPAVPRPTMCRYLFIRSLGEVKIVPWTYARVGGGLRPSRTKPRIHAQCPAGVARFCEALLSRLHSPPKNLRFSPATAYLEFLTIWSISNCRGSGFRRYKLSEISFKGEL